MMRQIAFDAMSGALCVSIPLTIQSRLPIDTNHLTRSADLHNIPLARNTVAIQPKISASITILYIFVAGSCDDCKYSEYETIPVHGIYTFAYDSRSLARSIRTVRP